MTGVKIKEFFKAQKKILSGKAYLVLFALSSFFFAWVFITLTTIPGQSFESWNYSVRTPTKIFVLIGSPLMALVLTTQVYVLRNFKFGRHEAKAGGGALGAFFAGAIATACCSPFVAGALAIIGFAGAANFVLEYDFEITALALIAITASLYYSSKIVYCEECRIKTNSKAKRVKA